MSVSVKSMLAVAMAFGGGMAIQALPASAQLYRGIPVYQGGYQRFMAGPQIGGGGAFARPVVTGGFAGPRWGGGYAGPRYGGWGGNYYRPGFYGSRYGWGGGYYRPGFYGARYGYYGGYYPYRYYRRGWDGGAVAAGLIGGLALGTIAGAATNPYYYGYPGYYRPAYYDPATTCVFERRRVVNRYGKVVVRRIRTCY